ncbi:calcium/calmodulin-dependent 3',5'-cyclic nucleotide phosphodiesterase 1C isoform X4 [Crotalus tigris]|uniref:calcium/calmodulin-dependent 3',5'-cyclic nucleotide phosphodiesterase 1C isoform X4 n=1 Tax=Crotalus tigris TaxID=88082 RepID=UPI00192F310B|nr:calcium/calmodulin-dependent 3',5'-cyclic nucleotide phosphodiesterase 1C isoform X4 [Crotalus tigris]
MTEPSNRKEGFKKCRSATFSIDGYSFTIGEHFGVANETGDKNAHPLSRFARSKSQSCLWNTIIGGLTGNIKEKQKPMIIHDPRPPEEILADELPPVESPDALVKTSFRRKYKKTSQRLRSLVKQLERGEASVVDLKKNLEYAATVLESVYIDETRRLLDTEDELSDIQSDSVPSEVRDWLASTFTRQMGMMLRRSEEKPRFRSIVHAVQAGIFVERMYRRTSNMVGLSYPPAVIVALKNVDKWSFDVFALNDASGDHALKFIFYELLTRYDLISRFKIPISALVSFVEALEVGYSKYKNPYHNLMHAADVTQTVHYLLFKTGVAHWLTELEIFAMIFAAAIHDYEHTGTTNNFHIQTRSDTAILYNDRSVLENHHLSAAFRLLQDDEEMNILSNLSKDDWREFRTLVIEMVLATDMSCHFQQIKAMKNALQQPEGIDKPKALSLMLHTADISHPAKAWNLHHRWTMSLLEEFFRQGDKEAELGLPFSPLCDRKSTMVPQSQIGFIDFIVEPTFTVLTDMTEKIVTPLIEEASNSGMTGFRRSSLNSLSPSEVKRSSVKSTGSEGSASLNCSILTVDFKCFKATWTEVVQQNREKWKTQAIKEEKAKKEAEENSQQGIDDKKMEENEGKKLPEDNITTKSEKSKQGNKEGSSGDSKSTEINKSNINGSRPTGGNKHGTSQGKNVNEMEKGAESKSTGGESKQQAQNDELKDHSKKSEKDQGNETKEGSKQLINPTSVPNSTDRLTLPGDGSISQPTPECALDWRVAAESTPFRHSGLTWTINNQAIMIQRYFFLPQNENKFCLMKISLMPYARSNSYIKKSKKFFRKVHYIYMHTNSSGSILEKMNTFSVKKSRSFEFKNQHQ